MDYAWRMPGGVVSLCDSWSEHLRGGPSRIYRETQHWHGPVFAHMLSALKLVGRWLPQVIALYGGNGDQVIRRDPIPSKQTGQGTHSPTQWYLGGL